MDEGAEEGSEVEKELSEGGGAEGVLFGEELVWEEPLEEEAAEELPEEEKAEEAWELS